MKVKVTETYAIRWNIEIGFKETKQLLGLGKHQANDFSSQIALLMILQHWWCNPILSNIHGRNTWSSICIFLQNVLGIQLAILMKF